MHAARSRHRILLVAIAAVCAASSARLHAQTDPHLFGDWNGSRTQLADNGFKFDVAYHSQVAHNMSGGTRHLTRYADQWTFDATLDLEKLWGWNGGSFQVTYTDRHGHDLGADAQIGSNQSLQDQYGRGQTLHLTVFTLEQTFLEGRIAWRIGRLPVGKDFATFSCDFQNLTFCGAQPGNIVGDYWINAPTSQWATRIKLQTSRDTYLQLGAYQVNPTYIDDDYAQRNGWKLDFPAGTTGVLVPLEFGWTPDLHSLPGSYKVGAWHSSSDGADLYLDLRRQPMALTGEAPLQHESRRGAYVVFKQQLSGQADAGGLTVFLRAVQADRATSATDRQIAIGAEYTGPFGRADDILGVGIGATHPNAYAAEFQRLYNQAHPGRASAVLDRDEYATAVFYRWRPVPAISLQPTLQYVVLPGGTTKNHNAFVVGFDTSITF